MEKQINDSRGTAMVEREPHDVKRTSIQQSTWANRTIFAIVMCSLLASAVVVYRSNCSTSTHHGVSISIPLLALSSSPQIKYLSKYAQSKVLPADSSVLKVKAIHAGSYHACAEAIDGKGYCWGYGKNGELGNGYVLLVGQLQYHSSHSDRKTHDSSVPVELIFPKGVTLSNFASGCSHTCAEGSDGHGYCWGYGEDGQLGNGYVFQL